MRRIRERVAVRCPIDRAQERLEEYFARRRDADGTTRLQLRVPLDGRGPLRGLALEHDVTAIAYRARDDQNLNDLVRIRWEPSGGGLFPAFSGTIVTWAEHDPNRSFVELDGTYDPPGGTGGEVFDETLGRAIAEKAAHTLLHDIARAITNRTPASEATS